jgi:hypothetical protein
MNNNNNRLKVITTALFLCCAVSTFHTATAAISCASFINKKACQNAQCMWFGAPYSPKVCGTSTDFKKYKMNNTQCQSDATSFLQQMQFYANNSGGTPPTGVQFKQCHMKVWYYFNPQDTNYHVHSKLCAVKNENGITYSWQPGNINTFTCN